MSKWSHWFNTQFMVANMAMLVLTGIVPTQARGQDALAKSEIVQLNDSQVVFCEQVDRLRTSFANISAHTPAWTRAEAASSRLAKDPANPELKRQMISARADFVKEKVEELTTLSKCAPQLDQAYSNYTKHLDAEILECKANVDQAQQSEARELTFLADSLAQLQRIKAFLPSDTTPAGDFTAEEHRKLSEFNSALRQAEGQLESVRASKNLHDHHMAVLAQIKIQAAREYLGIKRKVVQASQDRRAMVGIARNDLTALKILDDEARLSELQRRPPIDYSSDNPVADPTKIQYQLTTIMDQVQEESKAAPLTVDSINRIQALLKSVPSEQAPDTSAATVTDSTESKQKETSE